MHFVPLEEAAATLSAKKNALEAERQKWFERQTPEFQNLKKANNTAVNKRWSVTFIILLALICFVINAAISLTIFFVLEFTVYTDVTAEATQATRAIRALASMLILPVCAIIGSIIHNFRYRDSSPNLARLTFINHPDYPYWSERDDDLRSQIREIDAKLNQLCRRGLLYIDGEAPADPHAVLGTLYIDEQPITDLTYAEMPYEFHMDEGLCHVAIKTNKSVLSEQTVNLRHFYAVTVDMTGNPKHPTVDVQNMVRKQYDAERANMSRKGTVYVAQ